MAIKKVKLALLGAGRIGQVHAKAISSNSTAELYAVADVHTPSANAVATQYGCVVSSMDEIVSDIAVDGVVICTSTDTHSDLIERFARAGKAIFCEKPIDLSLQRVKACLTVVEQTHTTLMIGFNRRFDPHFAAAKQAVADGRIGRVEMVQITSRDPDLPPADYIKVSGGIFRDMTIHDFDMARFMLDEEPEMVFATASSLVDPEIEALGDFDSVSVIMTTVSGKHCTISNSRRAAYGYDQRVELHGSKGSVSVENQRPESIELATADGYIRPPLHDFFMTRYTAAYAAEISAFIKSLTSGSKPSPNGQDGLRSLALAEAALLSIEEKRPVQVSEIL